MKAEFSKVKTMDRIRKAVSRAVAAGAIEMQTAIQDKLNLSASNLSNGGMASAPGSPPANRSGALLRSIQAVNVTTDPNHPHWRVGTKLPYARIQEYGGRINAKKGKYLAIPLGPEGKRAMREANGNLRSLNLIPFRSPTTGHLFLVRIMYVGGNVKTKIKVLFRLVKYSILPARPYFRPAIAERSAKVAADIKAAAGGAP